MKPLSYRQVKRKLEKAGFSIIKSFLVPDLDRSFQEVIASYCHQSEKLRKDSKGCYNEAQTILLAELGLADWQPEQELTFIKNFLDTERAERIDADYFQPKYDKIVNTIKNYPGGWDTLENLTDLTLFRQIRMLSLVGTITRRVKRLWYRFVAYSPKCDVHSDDTHLTSLQKEHLKKCYTFRQIIFSQNGDMKKKGYKPLRRLGFLPMVLTYQMLHKCNILTDILSIC